MRAGGVRLAVSLEKCLRMLSPPFMGRLFRIFRSQTLQSPPEAVFGLVTDLARMEDMGMFSASRGERTVTFPGDTRTGEGAVLEWKGRQRARGRIEITRAIPLERVEVRVDCTSPWKWSYAITWELHPAEGGGTEFSYTLVGEAPFPTGWIMRLLNVERSLKRDVERQIAEIDTVLAEESKERA